MDSQVEAIKKGEGHPQLTDYSVSNGPYTRELIPEENDEFPCGGLFRREMWESLEPECFHVLMKILFFNVQKQWKKKRKGGEPKENTFPLLRKSDKNCSFIWLLILKCTFPFAVGWRFFFKFNPNLFILKQAMYCNFTIKDSQSKLTLSRGN